MAIAGGVLFACTHRGRVVRPVTDRTPTIETRWPIKRVVYIMLENRSFDCLFGTFPGANGATVGVSYGKEVPLIDCPDWLPGDLSHDHAAALNCLDGGKLDGFGTGIYGPIYGYSQLHEPQIPNYWAWARQFVLADNFFASALGPSYPNHFYFVAGQDGGVIDNPENIGTVDRYGGKFKSWGCDAVPSQDGGTFVFVKDEHGNLSKHTPCFDFPSVGELLSQHGIDWAFYSAPPGQIGYFWNAYNGISSVFHSDLWHEHIRDVNRIVHDIQANRLPPVTWVTPRFELSDHPPWSTSGAHNWVTGVVNAIMKSDMWEQTAIFLTWDEWGGLYDHVAPPVLDDVGLGFRVPLLTISPYAKRGYVDDVLGEFSSPLRFIADNWGLPYLTKRIRKTSNLEQQFDFAKAPRKPTVLAARVHTFGGNPFHFPESFPGWKPGVVPTTNPI